MNARPTFAAARHVRGVALLIAVLIVALLATASTWLAWQQTLAIRRSADMLASDRAWALALGGEAVAAQGLADSLRGATRVDLTQPWARPQRGMLDGGVLIIGAITDLQGRINLNGLTAAAPNQAIARWRLQRLLSLAGAQPDLVDAVTDWTNPVPVASGPGGAGDDYYLGLTPPYRTAAQPFVSVSSLRLVRGFTQPLYAALAPDLTALPQATAININTAPAAVLQALGLSAQQAQAIVAQRARVPFSNVAQFLANPVLAGAQIDPSGLDVGSRFFLSSIEVRDGRVRSGLDSVLELQSNGRVRVLLRARNATP